MVSLIYTNDKVTSDIKKATLNSNGKIVRVNVGDSVQNFEEGFKVNTLLFLI